MSQRRNSEIPFGSDSFLDVVCNVVGIVVILVVIAGIFSNRSRARELAAKQEASRHQAAEVARAKREKAEAVATLPAVPLRTEPASLPEQPAPLAMAPVLEQPEAKRRPRTLITEGDDQDWLPSAPIAVRELGRSSENQDATTEGEVELSRSEAQLARLIDEAAEMQDAITDLSLEGGTYRDVKIRFEEEAEKLTEELHAADPAEVRTDQSDETKEVGGLFAEVEAEKKRLAQLQIDVQKAQKLAGTTRTQAVIKHRLTPVARTVKGPEVHCRVANGKVSIVPFAALVDLMRDHVQDHRAAIFKSPRFIGTVGPVEGYHLSYVMEHQKASLQEELRDGRSLRAVVTGVTFHPEPDLETETPEQALQAGSRFLAAVELYGSAATVTLWVYPDSFQTHQTLKAAMHHQGINVASRPLPEGLPIAASPQGSASAAE